MTKNDHVDRQETKILHRHDGKRYAENFRSNNKLDPFPAIPHALLSAEDVKKYVFATGAVAPFFSGPESRRLKRAAYEGRVGDTAYEFDNRGALVKLPTTPLVVKANSIVFVECDLDFRLPDFIAARFNLQVRHVHRGLLLGTGPLIDPGYWGKLCIPLHNLTNEDYHIPKDSGLIWLEFTKTSLKTTERSVSEGLGGRRVGSEWWCIKDFIDEAAKPIGDQGKTVAIRSSIPAMAEEATNRAEKAEESARGAEKWVKGLGAVGLLAVLISLVGLSMAFYSNIQSAYNSIAPQVDTLQRDVLELRSLTARLDALTEENRALRERVRRLEGSTPE
jgi:deoxycytidine triphosphate deaminase